MSYRRSGYVNNKAQWATPVREDGTVRLNYQYDSKRYHVYAGGPEGFSSYYMPIVPGRTPPTAVHIVVPAFDL